MKQSAGILLYRRKDGRLELLLVHPGGPFWANKDDGAWSIPKGEYGETEEPLACALREFEEELGVPPHGAPLPLGEIRQAGGKTVTGFALAGDFDPAKLLSNRFEMEWPPRSDRTQSFPEIDRAEWFDVETARQKINAGQRALIEALLDLLAGASPNL